MRASAIRKLTKKLNTYDSANASPTAEVRMAKALVLASIDLLQGVADNSKDWQVEVDVVDRLKLIAGINRGAYRRDLNLNDWIKRLQKGAKK